MTLCIASLCTPPPPYDDTDAIAIGSCAIICFDHRVEIQTASAEMGFKFTLVSSEWAVLKAGRDSLTRELGDLYREHIITSPNFSQSTDLLEEFKKPIKKFRERKADDLVHSKLAISYDEFLKHGKERLNEQIHQDLLYDIRAQFMQEPYASVELILVGRFWGQFRIFKLSQWELSECDHFAVIGSGALTAEPVLYQRNLRRLADIPSAAYAIWEAKKLAEGAPGVGKETSMLLIRPLNNMLKFDPCNKNALDEQVKQFGPKPYVEGQVRPEDIFPHMNIPEHGKINNKT